MGDQPKKKDIAPHHTLNKDEIQQKKKRNRRRIVAKE
jgi:hypothetical protein